MRILFFCSCLEPGQDGVGDYVRLLAETCAEQGHACAIVALNDPYAQQPPDRFPETANCVAIARLPASLSWSRRVEFVHGFRRIFQPDWISFNLVPYAFHKRGILLGLIPTLAALTEGVPLHIMFHELWLGAGRPSPLRFYVVGEFQCSGVRRLLARLQPKLVTTSNPVYAAMLRKLQADALVLPLFGNVPLRDAAEISPVEQLLPGTGITRENRGEWWVGLFFGALHEQWKAEPFLGTLLSAAARAQKRVALVLIGRSGEAGRLVWRQLQQRYGTQIVFVNLGEQPADIISTFLHGSDFGIAGSPWQLIGKSGTVAAMLDHGLPAIVTRDDFRPFVQPAERPSDDPLLHPLDEHLEDKLLAGLPKRKPRARVKDIAVQLCAEMEKRLSLAP